MSKMDYHAYTQGRNYILKHNDAVSIENPYCPDTEEDLSTDWNKGYFSVWLEFWETDRLIDIETTIEVQGTLF